MNALLRLHREVRYVETLMLRSLICNAHVLIVYFDCSPKLAACAADLSSPYPDSALRFEALCHLIVSALAYWPVFGWTPGLFHSLLTNIEVTSLMALGPKETCSLLCVLVSNFS